MFLTSFIERGMSSVSRSTGSSRDVEQGTIASVRIQRCTFPRSPHRRRERHWARSMKWASPSAFLPISTSCEWLHGVRQHQKHQDEDMGPQPDRKFDGIHVLLFTEETNGHWFRNLGCASAPQLLQVACSQWLNLQRLARTIRVTMTKRICNSRTNLPCCNPI